MACKSIVVVVGDVVGGGVLAVSREIDRRRRRR
jgi:hypothetical protein